MYRLAEDKDLPHIYTGLAKLESQAARTGQGMVRADFQKACRVVAEVVASKKAYIVGSYLVLTDQFAPWYSNEEVLQEWFILKVYTEGGGLQEVPIALLSIAKSLGCKYVMSGDSSPVNFVAAAYEKAGWKVLTRSFYKGVDDGCS